MAGCLCIGSACQVHLHVSMRLIRLANAFRLYKTTLLLTRELLLIVHPLILSLILTLLRASWESTSSKRPEPCLATKTWMSCCSRPVRLTGDVLRDRSSAWRPMHQLLVPACWEQTNIPALQCSTAFAWRTPLGKNTARHKVSKEDVPQPFAMSRTRGQTCTLVPGCHCRQW